MKIRGELTYAHLLRLQAATTSKTVVARPPGGWSVPGIRRLPNICASVPHHRFVVVFTEPCSLPFVNRAHNIFVGCVGWDGPEGTYRYEDEEEAYVDLTRKAVGASEVESS